MELNRQILISVAACVFFALACVMTGGGPTSAQATLQPSTGALQTPAQQNQTGGNNLNQTGTLQNNSAGDTLNQTGTRPLGVVSNPRQTTPEVVAQPSPDLKTDITPTDKSSAAPKIAVVAFLLAALGILALRRNKQNQANTDLVTNVSNPAEAITSAHQKPKKKKSTQKKRRKKPHQR